MEDGTEAPALGGDQARTEMRVEGHGENFVELQGRDPWKNENLLTLLCYF